jgi:hypothetical protein
MSSSDFPDEFLAVVEERLRQEGVRTTRDGTALSLGDLGCRLRCSLVEGDFHPQLMPFRVLVEHGAFAEPVEDQVAAIGATPDAAVRYASDLWVGTFFHPFHAFVHGGPDQQPLAMVTTSTSGELLGWHVFTTEPFTNSDAAPSRMELFKHLITPLNPMLLDRTPHSLKCFIQKDAGAAASPGDKLTASCHFDNREWVEGLSQLLYLGDSWGEVPSIRMMRQWFFFKPATKADLGDAWDKITAAMQPPKKKPWWRVW